MIFELRTRPKRFRWGRWLLWLVLLWCLFACLLTVAIHLHGQTDYARKADAIVVLGAGLQPNNTPGPALTRRSNRAADLWQQGLAPVIICTGGKTDRATRTEASGCEELLLARGVPASAILLEDRSRSTEENALYARELFAANGWTSAVLVSDSYHVLRARWLFEGLGMTVYTSPVAASDMRFDEYVVYSAREIVAFHWLFVKRLLNLPYTYVGGI